MANSLEELRTQLMSRVKEVAQESMVDKVKDVEVDNIKKTVQDVYNPTIYVRRGSNNGLTDKNNMQVQMYNRGEGISIYIANNTRGNTQYWGSTTGYIAHIIEEGVGYTWKQSRIYNLQPYPRPFIQNTINDLKQNKQHVQALRDGLRDNGINASY